MKGLRIPTAKGTRVERDKRHRTKHKIRQLDDRIVGTLVHIKGKDTEYHLVVRDNRDNLLPSAIGFMRDWDLMRIRSYCRQNGLVYVNMGRYDFSVKPDMQ